MDCLWLLDRYHGGVQQLQQTPYGLQNLKIYHLVLYRKRLLPPDTQVIQIWASAFPRRLTVYHPQPPTLWNTCRLPGLVVLGPHVAWFTPYTCSPQLRRHLFFVGRPSGLGAPCANRTHFPAPVLHYAE